MKEIINSRPKSTESYGWIQQPSGWPLPENKPLEPSEGQKHSRFSTGCVTRETYWSREIAKRTRKVRPAENPAYLFGFRDLLEWRIQEGAGINKSIRSSRTHTVIRHGSLNTPQRVDGFEGKCITHMY